MEFSTGDGHDHIDYTITVDGLDNVVGIHIHNGSPGENNHVHLVDILPTDSSAPRDLIASEPVHGIIELADLCPGEHGHDEDDGDGGHGHDLTSSPDFIAILNAEQAVPSSDSLSTGTAAFQFNNDLTQLNYNIVFSGLDLDGHQTVDDGGHDDDTSECTANTLALLADEFKHGRAYINFHTDDGLHTQNTGPGDLFTPGEIRGNIGPGNDDTTFVATINASQQVLHGGG